MEKVIKIETVGSPSKVSKLGVDEPLKGNSLEREVLDYVQEEYVSVEKD